ncbi:PH domain-containing protein [Kribbella endophytica]
MTAFSRYRVCELLGVTPYEPYFSDLTDDPAGLFDEAAGLVDRLEVSIEGLSWRLALADALRSAAKDVRMVADAHEV